MRPPTGTAAPPAAQLACSPLGEERGASLMIRLEKRLESPSVFQPLTVLRVDVPHHAERFLNATFCSCYVSVAQPAQLAWHLNGRASKEVADGDSVGVPTRVPEMSQPFRVERNERGAVLRGEPELLTLQPGSGFGGQWNASILISPAQQMDGPGRGRDRQLCGRRLH